MGIPIYVLQIAGTLACLLVSLPFQFLFPLLRVRGNRQNLTSAPSSRSNHMSASTESWYPRVWHSLWERSCLHWWLMMTHLFFLSSFSPLPDVVLTQGRKNEKHLGMLESNEVGEYLGKVYDIHLLAILFRLWGSWCIFAFYSGPFLPDPTQQCHPPLMACGTWGPHELFFPSFEKLNQSIPALKLWTICEQAWTFSLEMVS